MEHCLVSGEEQNLWLQWTRFAGRAGVLLRKARAAATAQHQSTLQRLPNLPEFYFKKNGAALKQAACYIRDCH